MSELTQTNPGADDIAGPLQRIAAILRGLPARDPSLERTARERGWKRAMLRKGCLAPRRHMETTPARTGEWGQKLDAVLGRLSQPGALLGFVGTSGNGKTQMAVEIIKEFTDQLKSAQYVTAVGFFLSMKATFRRDAMNTEESIMQMHTRPQLLVLDECEKRGETAWENNLLFELINRRYHDRKDTILIANASPSDFDAYVGPSIVSRMNETGGLVEFTWKSFRT